MRFFKKKTWKFIGVAILLFLFIFISARGGDSPVRGAVLWISSPFLKTARIFSGGVHGFLSFLGSIGELKSENEQLVKEKQELISKIAQLGDIEKENELLRKEVDLAPREKYDLEASFVIAEDSLRSGNSIMIDKGASNGIQSGMPVIVSKGILTGTVDKVFSNSASIRLITNRDSSVNGEVLESGAKGIIQGTYGLGLQMNMISQTEVIKEGDTVISSGLGGELPRGLFVGKIGEVGQSDDKLFQKAALVSPVDFSAIKLVFVIKKTR